jgi:hypothetical protein
MRKRSKYKPKAVRVNNMAYVLSGMMQLSDLKDKMLQLQLTNHMALEALRTGTATKHDMDVIIAACNITEGLARYKIGNDYAAEIKEAQDALYACAKRGVAMGYKFVAKGLELKAINFIMELHDAQLEAATVKDIELATDYVNNMMISKRARPIVELT